MRLKDPGRKYFRAPDDDSDTFGGGGGGGAEVNENIIYEVSENISEVPENLELRFLLDRTSMPESINALGESLTGRVNEVVGAAFRQRGHGVKAGSLAPLVELSYDKARSRLAELMAGVRERLVATITKRGTIAEAVVLMDWRALNLVLGLAEKHLEMSRRFGDLGTETVDPDTASAIVALNIHRPLPRRQTPSERREARRTLASESKR